MRRILSTVFLSTLFVPLVVLSQGATVVQQKSADLFPVILKKGDSGESVKDLQNILKNDPVIYPGGGVTGFYGALTEAAIKRLQRRYGLPETGALDEATKEIIFPTKTRIDIRVVSPNGDEVWDKSELHEILWESTVGPIVINDQVLIPQTSNQDKIKPLMLPFFPFASLSLIRDSDQRFQYHIGTVNIYQSSFSWKIPQEIQTGNDYRVQIGVGGNVPCIFRTTKNKGAGFVSPCPLGRPFYSTSDTSDSPFKLTGVAAPPGEIVAKLKTLISQLEVSLDKLLIQVKTLRVLIDSL